MIRKWAQEKAGSEACLYIPLSHEADVIAGWENKSPWRLFWQFQKVEGAFWRTGPSVEDMKRCPEIWPDSAELYISPGALFCYQRTCSCELLLVSSRVGRGLPKMRFVAPKI